MSPFFPDEGEGRLQTKNSKSQIAGTLRGLIVFVTTCVVLVVVLQTFRERAILALLLTADIVGHLLRRRRSDQVGGRPSKSAELSIRWHLCGAIAGIVFGGLIALLMGIVCIVDLGLPNIDFLSAIRFGAGIGLVMGMIHPAKTLALCKKRR